MKYSFTCYGHENITAKHKTTLEFTKDKDLGLEGDCIVGVKADFSLKSLKKLIKSIGNNKKITIIIETMPNSNKNNNKDIYKKIKDNNYNIVENGKNINNKIKSNEHYNNKIIEKISAEINPNFNSDKEIVIRKTNFISERTFATRADKAAFELNRNLIEFLKEKENKIKVSIGKKQ